MTTKNYTLYLKTPVSWPAMIAKVLVIVLGQLPWRQLPQKQLPLRQLPRQQLPLRQQPFQQLPLQQLQGQLPWRQLMPHRTTSPISITQKDKCFVRTSTAQDNYLFRLTTTIGRIFTSEDNYPQFRNRGLMKTSLMPVKL